MAVRSRRRAASAPNLDAARCGIKVISMNSDRPIRFEFRVLNPNLMAPRRAPLIIEWSARTSSRKAFNFLDGETNEHLGTISKPYFWNPARTRVRQTEDRRRLSQRHPPFRDARKGPGVRSRQTLARAW